MTRRSGGSAPLLAAGAVLAVLALVGAALLPVLECPRLHVAKSDSPFHEWARTVTKLNHDVLGCAVCGGRGKVTPLRRWLWRGEDAAPP